MVIGDAEVAVDAASRGRSRDVRVTVLTLSAERRLARAERKPDAARKIAAIDAEIAYLTA